MMPWQAQVADVALEVDESGRFCFQLVIVTVPRQSGKTTLIGSVLEQRAATVLRARCWFTAQSGRDAVDWFLNEHEPLLASGFRGGYRLRRANGSESIRWTSSTGLVRPFPPTPEALHGKTSDLVVIDEPWAFDVVRGGQLEQAIVPTQATKPNAQVWKVSTAGDASSVWWLGTVETGRAAVRAGRRSGVAYFEWACPPNLDACDPVSWPVYHPAYGRTIGPESMRAALDMLGRDEFCRAYGNQWVSTLARVIPIDAWRRAAEDPVELPGPGGMVLAWDVAVDRSDAAIVAVWRDGSGVGHVEVADHRPGTGWLADRLTDLVGRWRPLVVAYDGAGPALDVADVLNRAGQDLLGLKAGEYAAACAGLLEALCADEPSVRYRPHPALDSAAGWAVRRALGDRWAWGRRQSSGSLACLTAMTVGVWAVDHAPAALGDFHIY